jgi:arylsulfatase A-like enzyme
VNLLPYLTGDKSDKPHETLYWRYGDQWAIRHGDWKLVVANGGSGRPELYDLAHDLGEQKDLASSQPEKAEELQRLWDAWNAQQAPPLAAKEDSAGQAPGTPKAKAAAKKAARKAARKAAAKQGQR